MKKLLGILMALVMLAGMPVMNSLAEAPDVGGALLGSIAQLNNSRADDPYAEMWGMSSAEVLSAPGITETERVSRENTVIVYCYHDSVPSQFVFLNDILTCVTVDSGYIDDAVSFDEKLAELESVYGPSDADSADTLFEILNILSPGIYSDADDLLDVRLWQVSEDVTLSLNLYSPTDYAVMYANMSLLFSDTAPEATVGTGIGVGVPLTTPEPTLEPTSKPTPTANPWSNISGRPDFVTPRPAATEAAEVPLTLSDIPTLWGLDADSVTDALGLDSCTVVDDTESAVSLLYLSGDENDIIGILVNDSLVGVMYDYHSDSVATSYEEQLGSIVSQMGMASIGGSDRLYAITEAIMPGIYASPSEFTDSRIWTLADGSIVLLFRYNDGSAFCVTVINEELLFQAHAQ